MFQNTWRPWAPWAFAQGWSAHGRQGCEALASSFPLLAFSLLVVVFAAGCSKAPGPIAIDLVNTNGANGADGSTPARIRVSGLSSAEAASLRASSMDAAMWRDLFRVTAGTDDTVAVAGFYAVVGTDVEFTPAFPFDPGRVYGVQFNTAKLRDPRQNAAATARISLPAGPNAPPVEVSAIYPSAAEWPANLLRFYVHFSGTMSRETGVGRVHLVDDSGEEIADALLPAEADFWSPDQTRYTVLFEPGRVKRGIQPNLEDGRALVPGRSYTIEIDAAWRDAAGRPLAKAYKRTFKVGQPREDALSMSAWQVSSPAAGSREPLTVKVPWPLDRALFLRTVGVSASGAQLAGDVQVADDETVWRFTPAAPWSRTVHELVVLSALEDPSGNRIGRAFEVLPTDPAASRELPETFTKAFAIR